MDDIKLLFGKQVEKLRKKKWLSQETLWAISWIHRTYISEIERWKANVSLEHIFKLSKALSVNLEILFSFDKEWMKNH